MTDSQAERWVVISAAIVAGVYAYRRVMDPTTAPASLKSALGIGPPLPVGSFVTAWGFTFVVCSIMATANPTLGGGFALLIATADFLANAPALFGEITKRATQKTEAAKTGTALTAAGTGLTVAAGQGSASAAGSGLTGAGSALSAPAVTAPNLTTATGV